MLTSKRKIYGIISVVLNYHLSRQLWYFLGKQENFSTFKCQQLLPSFLAKKNVEENSVLDSSFDMY